MARRLIGTFLAVSVSFVSIFLIGNLGVAQPIAVAHEIKSRSDDGAVTVWLTLMLPNEFARANGVATVNVGCGGVRSCHRGYLHVTGTPASGITGGFSMLLSPGDYDLSISASLSSASLGRIEHRFANYPLSLSRPKLIDLEHVETEIKEFNDDGTVDLTIAYLARRAEEWPVTHFRASAECVEEPNCFSEIVIRPGWNDDPVGTPHGVYIELGGVVPGERQLKVRFESIDPAPSASFEAQSFEFLHVSIPVAKPPNVRFVGYDIVGYNEDGTATVQIEFEIERADAWPISSVSSTLHCVELACGFGGLIERTWSAEMSNSVIRWGAFATGFRPGVTRLSATFSGFQQPWLGADRSAEVAEITIDIEPQPEYKVVWDSDVEVIGYFMNGEARVNLELQVRQIGFAGPSVQTVQGLCFETVANDRNCANLETPIELDVGRVAVKMKFPDLRLGQGVNAVYVDAGRASGSFNVEVPDRFVGASREVWNCFVDPGRGRVRPCAGLEGQRVRKWDQAMVNVYRDGDPHYVAVFDEALNHVELITGIEYEIVDSHDEADVEAYLAHPSNQRTRELFGSNCNVHYSCVRHAFSESEAFAVEKGYVSVAPVFGGKPLEKDVFEKFVRYDVGLAATMVLVPHEHGSFYRDWHRGEPPFYTSAVDVKALPLLYLPQVTPGMLRSDIREFVVFADETLDYVPSLPDIEFVGYRLWRELVDAGSVALEMRGAEIQGNKRESGPSVQAQFSMIHPFQHRLVKVSAPNLEAIILGFSDEETWVFDGSRWAIEPAPAGITSVYRRDIKFGPSLVSPIEFLTDTKQYPGKFELRRLKGGSMSLVREAGEYPAGSYDAEIVFDPETYRVQSYRLKWYFHENVRPPYEVEAWNVKYGEGGFEVPDDIRKNSPYYHRHLR